MKPSPAHHACLLLLGLLASALFPLSGAAREQLFNEGWLFLLGNPPAAETAGFADRDWRRLDLPHDWSIEGDFSETQASSTGYLPGGTGWYRKHFSLSETARGKQVFLRFEGVYRNSDVWLNGHHLGYRPNGYIDFEYDLTPYLRAPGKQNVIAVRVARENVADSRWYPGSGIYRDTWLTVLDPIHVTRHGSFVTTPVVDKDVAEVNSTCEREMLIQCICRSGLYGIRRARSRALACEGSSYAVTRKAECSSIRWKQ